MKKLSPYLSIITKTGSTLHLGGNEATLALLNKTNLTKSSIVLDVGCGAGHSSAFVAKHYGCKVVGVDFSSDAVENAKALYGKGELAKYLEFKVADAQFLPFADNSFDVVLCESVLIFVKDKEEAIKEFYRVTKKNGFIGLNEVCAFGDNAQDAIEFFARKEFGASLVDFDFYKKILSKFKLKTIIESVFCADLKIILQTLFSQIFSQKIFSFLEIGFLAFTDNKIRKNFLDLFIVSKNSAGSVLNNLSYILLLAKKTSD